MILNITAGLGEAASFFDFKLCVMVDWELIVHQQADEVVVIHEQIVRCQGFRQAWGKWMVSYKKVNYPFSKKPKMLANWAKYRCNFS